MSDDELVRSVSKSIEVLRDFIQKTGATDTGFVQSVLRTEIEDTHSLAAMKVLASFVSETWD